jgi:LacI family transcriptional regulator, sucrose operon repressor
LKLNTPANKRYEGFMHAINESGVEHILVETVLSELEKHEHRKMAIELLNEHPDIDGVFASSDMIAAKLIDVAKSFKKKVPKDIKIVGYDDVSIAALISPALTTIRQPIEQMGKLLVELIIKQIDGEVINIENILPVELIERKST